VEELSEQDLNGKTVLLQGDRNVPPIVDQSEVPSEDVEEQAEQGFEPVSSAACPHVAEPMDNWALRLLQAAAVHLEGGDFGAALEAHVRLLLGDERLPSEQLFNVSYLRERGGWRATITIATGRQFAGAVRAGQRAAYASAMESAMDHVIDAGLSITQAVSDRLKKFEPSTTRSGGK
jgi:hypothetical protein